MATGQSRHSTITVETEQANTSRRSSRRSLRSPKPTYNVSFSQDADEHDDRIPPIQNSTDLELHRHTPVTTGARVDHSNPHPRTRDIPHASTRKQKEPQTFDGTTDFKEYTIHFEQVAEWNNWSSEEKAQQLIMSLRGSAQRVLSDLTLGHSKDYEKVKSFLIGRFDPPGRDIAYGCQLKCRSRRDTESLVDYGQELRRLAALAFPDLVGSAREITVIDQFIMGIGSFELRKHVQFKHPTTLEAAITAAIEFEAFENEQVTIRKPKTYIETDQAHVHAFRDSEPQGSHEHERDLASLLLEGFEKLGKQLAQTRGDNPRYKRCYKCGEIGHIKRNCQKEVEPNSTVPKNMERSSVGSTHGGEINFLDKTIKLAGQKVDLATDGYTGCARIRVKDTVKIPPNSEFLLKAYVDGVLQDSGVRETQGLVEPTAYVIIQGLLMAKTLVDPCNQEITLSVLNLGQKGVGLSENTIVGKLNSVGAVHTIGSRADTNQQLPEHLVNLVENVSPKLSLYQKQNVRNLVSEYQDIFMSPDGKLGQTSVVEHEIDTGGQIPIKLPARRLSPAQKETVEIELDN
ncbi:uncharacterized protein LOC132547811 [Ylistrum balloti]|uniref:uncharacterized protein LOC132547811 n=1 Tax=Ylistrum balloti TaxID=509963 RepID=UPI0029058DC5|nr:uncharacterized protein LOC132547811 [Ylistrum balloti]